MTGNLFPARLRVSHQDRRQNTNYRRNGKLQACEPCRRGKLRCDHMTPTCGRCTRLNKAEQCVYHPAPLTKAAPAPSSQRTSPDHNSPAMNSYSGVCKKQPIRTSPNAFSSLERRTNRSGTFPELPSLAQLAEYNCVPALNTELDTNDYANRLSTPSPSNASEIFPVDSPQSHHGLKKPGLSNEAESSGICERSAFISDIALLAEHEGNVGILPSLVDALPMPKVSQVQIDQGATVLTLLKDLPIIQRYIEKFFSFAAGIVVIEPMVKIYIDGLWSTWHKTLEAQKPADLKLMSEKVWENTLKPTSRLLNKHTTPREFSRNVTGAFLRWEVVGIIVSLVSLLAQSLKDGDPVFCTHEEAPENRAALALKMHEGSEMCISFCDSFGVLNDLYLWLLYENYISCRSMSTRENLEKSKKISILAAALIDCNLHQEIKVDDRTPFFMAELRKRLFICAYEKDKRFATSTGKPPKLTRTYCRLQTPMDVSDAQLMSDGPVFEDALGALDSEGWNMRGEVQRCTFARLSVANALITEEILEISLGQLSEDEIAQRATNIESRTNKCWEDLPTFLRIDADNPWDSTRSPLELLFLFSIRLSFLAHHFLLQRTLSKKVRSGSPGPDVTLLSICEEIFNLVLLMVNNKDRFRDFQVDFVSLLTAHGVPAAAVLAVELLHQERNPTSSSAKVYPLHRSDNIQNLSVFASCLGSVKAETGSSHNCSRARNFLKTILDLILGPGPAALSTGSPDIDEGYDPTLGAPLLQPGSDADFVQWLDTMVWDQDSWISFN